MVYGGSRNDAISKAEALALRILADRLEHGEEGKARGLSKQNNPTDGQ